MPHPYPTKSRCEKLLVRVQQGIRNCSFTDLCKLAECWGYHLDRHDGTSHQRYLHETLSLPNHYHILILVPHPKKKGQVKPVYVRNLLARIDYIREHHPELVRSED